MKEIISHRIVSRLTQLVLQYLAPGKPDLYPDIENGGMSFADPDNHSANQNEDNKKQLEKIILRYRNNAPGLLEELWANAEDGKIEQLFGYICLQERRNKKDLFVNGSYVPRKWA